jgi:hypothetical protein
MARKLGIDAEIDLVNVFRLLPNLDPSYPQAGRDVHTYAYADETRVPFIAFSHLPYEELFADKPIVFLARQPADTLVSYYFHVSHKVRQRQQLTAEDDRQRLAKFVLNPERGAPALADYWNGWAPHLESALVESYENLREKPLAGFRRITRYLGLAGDLDLLREALSFASFERMQSMERTGGIANIAYDRDDPEALRVRRGKVGGHADYLDAGSVTAIGEVMDSHLTPATRSMLRRAGIDL